jgi:uncharacterized protein (DUF2252 family)
VGADLIDAILARNAGRVPDLLARKFDAMRKSAFAFLRAQPDIGIVPADLAGLPATPLANLCGDLHIENFGCFPSENGLVYFDVVDFDQSARGPLAIDFLHFLASLSVALEDAGFASDARRRLLTTGASTVIAALRRGKSFWYDRKLAVGATEDLIAAAAGADNAQHLAERTVSKGAKRRIVRDGERYLDPFDRAEAAAVGETARDFALRSGITKARTLDVAFRVAGKGSLGLPRYLVLILGDDGALMIDAKLAMPLLLVDVFPGTAVDLEPDRARSIASAQERWQAVPPPYLSATIAASRPFLLRGHHPQDDAVKVKDLERLDANGLGGLVVDMARVAAWGLLRGAGRGGAVGPDEVSAFAHHIAPDGRVFIDAARDVAATVKRAHAAFARAWPKDEAERNPRLVAATRT